MPALDGDSRWAGSISKHGCQGWGSRGVLRRAKHPGKSSGRGQGGGGRGGLAWCGRVWQISASHGLQLLLLRRSGGEGWTGHLRDVLCSQQHSIHRQGCWYMVEVLTRAIGHDSSHSVLVCVNSVAGWMETLVMTLLQDMQYVFTQLQDMPHVDVGHKNCCRASLLIATKTATIEKPTGLC